MLQKWYHCVSNHWFAESPLMSLDFHGNGNTKLDQSMGNKCVIMAILGRLCVRVGSGHLHAVNQSFKCAKIHFD